MHSFFLPVLNFIDQFDYCLVRKLASFLQLSFFSSYSEYFFHFFCYSFLIFSSFVNLSICSCSCLLTRATENPFLFCFSFSSLSNQFPCHFCFTLGKSRSLFILLSRLLSSLFKFVIGLPLEKGRKLLCSAFSCSGKHRKTIFHNFISKY